MKTATQLSALLLLLCSSLAFASEPCTTTSSLVVSEQCLSDSATVSEVSRHIRVSPSKARRSTLVVKWAFLNPDGPGRIENRLEVGLPPISESDHLGMSRASYKLTSHRPGSDSTICEGSVAADYNKGVNAFSIVLRHNAAGTLVCMGADKASCTISLASGTQMISSPEIESATGCAILRDDTRISYRRPHETAPFADLEELKDYMRRSTDIHEGFWTYLDRDMDHRRASLGGNYTLATVASESGYDIVYINGSDSKGWKSLMIKGHMHSTLFMHHFDLEWKDINGSTAGNEASASVSDGAILSLSFPLLKTTVRFRKVPVKDL